MARQKFEDFNFNKQLLEAISDAGYVTPTPIQQKAIPPIMSGQDVMGIAETGTGKTAAFVLPLLMKLKYAQGEHPRALILSPTRELAMQIAEHVALMGKYTDLRTVVLYGGVGPKAQIEALGRGVDIIVSTPGRFLDLYLASHIMPRSLKYFVMDEADKMMDMGFIGKLHRILEVVPRKRQNLLFSATMSALVHQIAGDFLEFPTVVEASEQATPARTVKQSIYYVPNLRTKINLLRYLLEDEEAFRRVIVFCRTRVTADQVSAYLSRIYGQDQVRVIHANKGQNTRINSMAAFKAGEIRILVATDVAARGIDVSEVSQVINFDVPIVTADYVHRIGRTGRALNVGEAITFCDPAEVYTVRDVEKLIRQQIPVSELPTEVQVEETGYEEKQRIAREIDQQRRKENPDFKGAFHEKKYPKKSIHAESRRGKSRVRGGSKRRSR